MALIQTRKLKAHPELPAFPMYLQVVIGALQASEVEPAPANEEERLAFIEKRAAAAYAAKRARGLNEDDIARRPSENGYADDEARLEDAARVEADRARILAAQDIRDLSQYDKRSIAVVKYFASKEHRSDPKAKPIDVDYVAFDYPWKAKDKPDPAALAFAAVKADPRWADAVDDDDYLAERAAELAETSRRKSKSS